MCKSLNWLLFFLNSRDRKRRRSEERIDGSETAQVTSGDERRKDKEKRERRDRDKDRGKDREKDRDRKRSRRSRSRERERRDRDRWVVQAIVYWSMPSGFTCALFEL